MMPNPTESLPLTEQENPRTTQISSLSTEEIVRLMNEEDARVPEAVREVLPSVARAVDEIVGRIQNGGRLFYIGTGTSGRLGVLDASECPPTFGVSPDMVQAVIAGGYDACYRAVEASEDDKAAGATDLERRGFTKTDVLVGIAASGRTPYTLGAIEYARRIGAMTIAITCVPDSAIAKAAEIPIVALVGPEVIAGSTRLKAGTAQKLILNLLSTATMIKLGYVTGNRMTNVQTRNVKLQARAVRIVMAETGLDEDAASQALAAADGKLPVALVMTLGKVGQTEAKQALTDATGVVKKAVAALRERSS